MRKLFSLLATGIVFGMLAISVYAQQPDNVARKIIVFQKDFVNEASQSALVKEHGAEKIKHLALINGMAVSLPPQAESALLRRAEVLRIDDDLIIQASDKPDDSGKPDNNRGNKNPPPPPPQPAEVVPWGVHRINADLVWPFSTFNGTGVGIKVAIMDTGIDLNHPDLQNNIKGQVNTINPTQSADDDNGHGTHVAGTVAAIRNNGIGVIGVGPDISLYAVKVLNKKGSGFLSDLIEGLDWCISNKIQVVNMSLGSSGDNQSFHDAIIRAHDAGIVEVAAAGNNGKTTGLVDYPARYPETIAVSAVGQNTGGSLYFASFSSSGQRVDLAAPGVNINSTYNTGYYALLSGTSMATPHVTGVVVLVIGVKGQMLPDTMKVYLKSSTHTEYIPGLTSYQQGAGLVRADLAAQ